MTPKETIAEIIKAAILAAQDAGKLPAVTLPEMVIERPQNPEHGDYASSISLKLARAVGTNPLEIANEIAAFIKPSPEIGSVTVAPPGFINFTLDSTWLSRQVDVILESGENYGNINIGENRRIQIEFVSINPTGPLHVGHGRGAAVGDSVARILASCGWDVQREYYINDSGRQIRTLGRSVYLRVLQLEGRQAAFPEECYQGEYIRHMAAELKAEMGPQLLAMDEADAVTLCARRAAGQITLGGNVEARILEHGSAAETEAATRAAFEGGKTRMILANSAGPISPVTPKMAANYHRLIDVWEELSEI